MKAWELMIVACLSIQALGVYGSVVVFNSVENSLTEFHHTQITNNK